MADRWRIELLGGLRVCRPAARAPGCGGVEGEGLLPSTEDWVITRFAKQKAGALLACLAYRPSASHRRENLVEALWPGGDLEVGRNNLRGALFALRQQLEPPGMAAGTASPEESLLIADRDRIGLRPGAFTTDVAEWESTLDEARRATDLSRRIALLTRAVGLYRGELLAEYHEDWILAERERRSQEYLAVLHELTTALEQAGDLEHALEYARRAVSADPLREEAHCELMRLYAAAGQPSATLRQYQDLERILREDLGEVPSAATRAFAEELCSNARAVVAARTARPVPADRRLPTAPEAAGEERSTLNARRLTGTGAGRVPSVLVERRALSVERSSPSPTLPPQFTRFFGREEEIIRVAETLCLSDARLVTLTGPGGSGKTRLAMAVAARLAGAGPQASPFVAIAFVPLADVSDARRIGTVVADAIGAAPGPPLLRRALAADPLERAVGALQGDLWLLVLDNLEHLDAEGALEVRRLLERHPDLTCLVTSRQRLHLAGELEFVVLPLPTPRNVASPDRLMEFASVQLFVDRARGVQPGFRVTEANAAVVAQLCDRLEGLPLALELAAARAAILSPAQMLAHLTPRLPAPGEVAGSAAGLADRSRRFELLVSRQRDLPARHRTLQAAIASSYELLTPELQRFFTRLSVFRGGWTLEAAEAVCGEAMSDEYRSTSEERAPVLDYLEQLCECSLILAEEAPVSPHSSLITHHPSLLEMRYRMLETLREFAAERFDAGERNVVCRRHVAYFLALADQSAAPLAAAEAAAAVTRLEQEFLNIRAALTWSLEDDTGPETGLRLACRLRRLWQGYAAEGREWLTTALAKLPDASPSLRAEAFHLTGSLAGSQNDVGAARAALQEALALRRAIGDGTGVPDILMDLALCERAQGRFATAQAFLEEAVVIGRELGDGPGVGWALENLAWIVELQGERVRADALLKESLTIGRACESLEIVAYLLHGLGWLAALQGDLAGARPLLEQSLEAAREVGQRPVPLSGRSRVNRRWQELAPDAARIMLDQTLSFSRALGHQWAVMHHLGALGHLARSQGDYAQCAAYYGESLSLRQARGDRFAIAQSLEDFAGLAGRQEQHERAARLLGAAEALCERIGRPLPVAVPEEYERTVAQAQEAMGEAAFAAAWAAGRKLSLEEAIAYAGQA